MILILSSLFPTIGAKIDFPLLLCSRLSLAYTTPRVETCLYEGGLVSLQARPDLNPTLSHTIDQRDEREPLKLEIFQVNQSLLDMHKAADSDAHLCDFLEANFLDEQVDGIKEISGWITKLKRNGPGLGFYMIDKDISG